jgi:hypothetical protein
MKMPAKIEIFYASGDILAGYFMKKMLMKSQMLTL